MRALLLLLIAAATAAAEPSLVLEHAPAPRHLRMRTAQLSALKPTRTVLPMPAAPRAPAPGDQDELAGLRDLRDHRVSVTVNLGYAVEAAPQSNLPTLGGRTTAVGVDYARIRSYGFGEVFVSERGLAFQSVSGYLAMRFEALEKLTANGQPLAPPLATWFTSDGKDVRTGWVEAKDFLPSEWGLSKLRIRAGNEYVYGAWPMHINTPLMLGWDGQILQATGYAGYRHPDYIRDIAAQDIPQEPFVYGATARFDLRGLHAPLPITAAFELLHVDHTADAIGNVIGLGSSHSQIELDWRPRRDLALIGQMRWQDGKAANEHVTFRGRFKQVTNVVAELTVRQDTDWQWDPSVVQPVGDVLTPRRYLDLGPVLPQAIASLRAGTLILENVDLYGRLAIARDLTKADETKSGTNASYYELGGAIEVRLRRTMSVTASATTHQTRLEKATPIVDTPGVVQDLPVSAQIGETSFSEAGSGVRMSLGARRFSAQFELYGRRTHYADLYESADTKIPTTDWRGGGRFTLDAWIGQRVRLFAEYDLSTALDFAPEVTGFKSLRLAISGTY